MLNCLGSINSINTYKSSSGQSLAPIIGTASNNLNGSVKFANFTTTATNLYGNNPVSATVSSTNIQNVVPSISTSALITNSVFFTSTNRWKISTGSFAFDSSNGLTISVWLNPSTPYNGSDIKVFEGDSSERMLLWQGSNSYNFAFNNSQPYFLLGLGTWFHLVCVMNRAAGSQSVFVNGVLIGTANGVDAFPASTSTISQLSIGCSISTGHKPYTGLLTDYRLYPRMLNASEIYSIYKGYS
jgi:hypothetical protein